MSNPEWVLQSSLVKMAVVASLSRIGAGSFQIEWNNEVYHSNDRSVSFTYFADLSLSYRRKRYEIALTCHNLLGKSEYLRHQITDTQQIYTITRLRGRDVLMRIMFTL